MASWIERLRDLEDALEQLKDDMSAEDREELEDLRAANRKIAGARSRYTSRHAPTLTKATAGNAMVWQSRSRQRLRAGGS